MRASFTKWLCSANKRLDLEAPISAHVCTLTTYLRQPIVVQIVNVLHLQFKGQWLESSTLGSSNVTNSQTVTDRTNVAIANTESRIWAFDWHTYIWRWPILNVRVKVMRISTIISRKRWQIGRTLLLSTPRKSHVAFQLAYLHLTLVYFKGQGQGHAYFNCWYLANGNIQGKHC